MKRVHFLNPLEFVSHNLFPLHKQPGRVGDASLSVLMVIPTHPASYQQPQQELLLWWYPLETRPTITITNSRLPLCFVRVLLIIFLGLPAFASCTEFTVRDFSHVKQVFHPEWQEIKVFPKVTGRPRRKHFLCNMWAADNFWSKRFWGYSGDNHSLCKSGLCDGLL